MNTIFKVNTTCRKNYSGNIIFVFSSIVILQFLSVFHFRLLLKSNVNLKKVDIKFKHVLKNANFLCLGFVTGN